MIKLNSESKYPNSLLERQGHYGKKQKTKPNLPIENKLKQKNENQRNILNNKIKVWNKNL